MKKYFMKSAIRTISIIVSLSVCYACSNENSIAEYDNPVKTKGIIIPYSADVTQSAKTRASVNESTLQLLFEAGDQLEISGTNISGTLTLSTGAGTSSGHFTGSLTYTGSGTPDPSLALTAKLISSSNALTGNDYSTAIAASLTEAVQKYSNLTGSSTYSAKSFSLTQNSSFISFNLSFGDGSTTDGDYTATISDTNGTPYSATGSVSVSSAKAEFVAAFAGGTTLVSPKVTVNSKDFAFGSASTTLAAGYVYPANKVVTLADIDLSTTGSTTTPDNSIVTVTGNGSSAVLTIGDGSTVTLSGMTAQRLVLNGDATLILTGTNSIVRGGNNMNAISLTTDKTLTIKGTGSLTANTSEDKNCGGIIGSGNLIIESGTIVMKANDVYQGTKNPAIDIKSFTMTGGELTAWGGNNYYYDENRSAGIKTSGDILVQSGTINTEGSYGMYAGGTLTISGGTIISNGRGNSQGGYNAGMGAEGLLTISGGNVSASGAGDCPGIGSKGTCGNILISGGTVTAVGGSGGAAIGTGASSSSSCGTITIKSTVTSVSVTKGAGATDYIGKGNADSTVGTITIEDNNKITYN